MNLGEDIAWKKLLYKGEFDDPEFYLAGKKGRKDFRREMEATIRTLLGVQEIHIKAKPGHPQCFFPARFLFLSERLKWDPRRIPVAECEDLKKYTDFAAYTGVSLVFSSYFADNPASMFGHTLLRLHREHKVGEVGLLDDAANFAAEIGTYNPFTYPVKGLFGGFQGRFMLLAYSDKIQEYSNFESRDLWEYELNFSPSELKLLARSLWEASYFWMDYYYLDENCSYMMLALLEAAKPELDLTSAFHLYTIPSDTIKQVARQPGLIKGISFKASARTRFLERADKLQVKERRLFRELADRFERDFDKDQFEAVLNEYQCDVPCRVRVFDTLIEYIDFTEKKVAVRKLDRFSKLRNGLLIARSKIQQAPPPFVYRPEHQRPDLGPRSATLEMNTGWTNHGGNVSELRWRPAHHELTSPSLGYSDQLEIQVLDLIVARQAELRDASGTLDGLYIKRWTPLELTSLGKHELGLSPKSWRFELSYNKERSRKEVPELNGRSALTVGFGGARFWGPFGAYLMAQFSGGYSSDSELFWHGGAGPRGGLFWNFSDSLKWSAQYEWMKLYGRRSLERRFGVSRLTYAWGENETYLEFRDEDFAYYTGAGYRFFF